MTDPSAEPEPADDGVAYFRSTAWEAIAPGFATFDEVAESLVELALDDDAIPLDEQQATALLHELWQLRSAQLADGPRGAATDDAKVLRAFDALSARGLVTRLAEDFDQSEAGDQCLELARETGAHGYAFFHEQDAARLAYPDAELYIGFDAVAPAGERFPSKKAYDAAAVAVGREVVDALEAEGLEVVWDGTPRTRPVVRHLEWRRPLPKT